MMNLSEISDSERWSLFLDGDKDAFSHIYEQASGKLYQFGLRFTSDEYIIEDTLHDLFSYLLKHRDRISQTDNILGYLMKSFRRELFRKIEKERRFDHHVKVEDVSFEVTWSVEQDFVLRETDEHKSRKLLLALNDLTPRQKEAVYLRFYGELEYKSVADIMDVSVEACRNLIYDAIKHLKASIGYL